MNNSQIILCLRDRVWMGVNKLYPFCGSISTRHLSLIWVDNIGSQQDSGFALHHMFRVRIPILNKWEHPQKVFMEEDCNLYHDHIYPIVENNNAFLYTQLPQNEARFAVSHHPCNLCTRIWFWAVAYPTTSLPKRDSTCSLPCFDARLGSFGIIWSSNNHSDFFPEICKTFSK